MSYSMTNSLDLIRDRLADGTMIDSHEFDIKIYVMLYFDYVVRWRMKTRNWYLLLKETKNRSILQFYSQLVDG